VFIGRIPGTISALTLFFAHRFMKWVFFLSGWILAAAQLAAATYYVNSHDNEGGFMLICTPGNSYCEDTVIRYNISQNDGINSARIFHFAGGARNTRVYNNTIYVSAKQDLPLLLFTDWNGANGMKSLAGYRFREKSGLAGGIIVTNNGGRDFFGHAVPAQKPPSVGAAESSMP
jgi:hypothetical protein